MFYWQGVTRGGSGSGGGFARVVSLVGDGGARAVVPGPWISVGEKDVAEWIGCCLASGSEVRACSWHEASLCWS